MAGEKVLLVEDNVLNMELVTDLLEFAGYKVMQSTTAEEGLKIARHNSPDLILMDIRLPIMDGLSVINILRQEEYMRDIPVIALTAHAMKEDIEKILDAGFDGYITKPINTRIFVEQISRFFPEKRELG